MEDQTTVKKSLTSSSGSSAPDMPSGSTEQRAASFSPPSNLPVGSAEVLKTASEQKPSPAAAEAAQPAAKATVSTYTKASPDVKQTEKPAEPQKPAGGLSAPAAVPRPPITPPGKPPEKRPMLCVTKNMPPQKPGSTSTPPAAAKVAPPTAAAGAPAAKSGPPTAAAKPAEMPRAPKPIEVKMTTNPPSNPRQQQSKQPAPAPTNTFAFKPVRPGTSDTPVLETLKKLSGGGEPEKKDSPKGEDIKIPAQNNMQMVVFAVLAGVLVLAIGAGAYYYINISKQSSDFFNPGTQPPEETPEEQPIQLTNQGEFQVRFTNTTTTIDATELDDIPLRISELSNSQQVQRITQVIIALNGSEINLAQFKEAFNLNVPAGLAAETGRFSYFLVNEDGVLKSALIIPSAGAPESIKTKMLEWEQTMVGDITPLLLGSTPADPANPKDFSFKDSSKFPNGRYISLSQSQKLSIDYSILPDKIVIATSYTTLDQLLRLVSAWEQ